MAEGQHVNGQRRCFRCDVYTDSKEINNAGVCSACIEREIAQFVTDFKYLTSRRRKEYDAVQS